MGAARVSEYRFVLLHVSGTARANFGKDGKPEPLIAKISQETVTETIGTTRFRVSFFMNKFRKMGLIQYNGGIEVHTSLLNLVLHEQPQIVEAGSSREDPD